MPRTPLPRLAFAGVAAALALAAGWIALARGGGRGAERPAAPRASESAAEGADGGLQRAPEAPDRARRLAADAAAGATRAPALAPAAAPLASRASAPATLVVRVLDAAGTPAPNVPLALLRETSGGTRSERRRAVTNERGEARFRRTRLPAPGSAFVVVDGLFLAPLEAPLDAFLDPALPAGDPAAVLRLPPAGELLVLAVGPTDEIVPCELALELTAVEPGWPDAPSARRGPPLDVALERGRRRILAEAGLDVLAAVRHAGLALGEPIRARGPAPGGTADLRVPLAGEPPILTGRLLDADREPLPGDAGNAALEVEGLGRTTLRYELDAASRFRLAPALPWRPGLRATLELGASLEPGKARRVIDPLPPGTTDLGDLVLGDSLLLVAGTLTDPEGVPLPVPSLARASFELSAPDAAVRFDEMRLLGPGAFEVRGATTAKEIVVQVSVDDCAPSAPVRVATGARGVVLSLRAPGALEGRVLLDAGLEGAELELQLERRDEATGSAERVATRGAGAGVVRFEELAAGAYRVVALALRSGEELARTGWVDVRPGATARPPELDPLDLRGRLRRLRVRARRADGAAVRDLRIAVRRASEAAGDAPEAGWSTPRAPVDADEVLVLATARAVDLLVLAEDAAAVLLERVTASDVEVVLPHGLRARLDLGPLAREEPVHGRIVLTLEDDARGLSRAVGTVRARIDGRAEVPVVLPVAGRWRATLEAQGSAGPASGSAAIDVADVAGVQRIPLPLEALR